MSMQSKLRSPSSKGPALATITLLLVVSLLSLTLAPLMRAQSGAHDPGVRGGAAGAGGPLRGLTSQQGKYFSSGQDQFSEVQSVTGAIPGEGGGGLGPRFNSNSCGSCHAQPSLGGSSPSTNPQVAVATLDGATNVVPSFIALDG